MTSINYKSFPPKTFQEEEEKEIQEAMKTPFDIVMSILSKVSKRLNGDPLEKDVEWVIKIIHSKRLYSFQGVSNASKMNHSSLEMKSIIGYLDEFSETKTMIHGPLKKLSLTTKLKPLTSTFKLNNFLQKKARSVILKLEEEKEELSEGILFENDSETEEAKNEQYIPNISNNYTLTKKPEELESIEEHPKFLLSSMEFDIFNYFEQYGNNAFEYGACGILSNFNLDKYSSTQQVKNFIREVKKQYSKDAYYHNEMHGLDVLQTVFAYFSNTSLAIDLSLNEIDIISLIIGALVHDLGHGGYSNDFQIKTHSDLAIRYNDRNVLENYHVSKTFELLKERENNLLENIGKDEYKIFRKRMIELILATDMLFHSKICALMKSHINPESGKLIPFNQDNFFEEQQDVMNFILHSADISHCSKDFIISSQWTDRINQEFWRQGDYEKTNNLPISFLCDRTVADVPRSQIGFIKGIILPTFDLLTFFLPELNYYRENVNTNLQHWGELIKENDEQDGKINAKI